MNNTSFIFPGQGSQFVGMSKCILSTEISKKIFNIVNNFIGYDLLDIIINGPEDLLRKTRNTQPAIFTLSLIIDELLKDKNIYPIAVAGHSLGEYSALVSSEVISFEDAIKLVIIRSKEMDKANKLNSGSMAAIMNTSNDVLEDILNEIPGTATIANYNSENQLVISGERTSIENSIQKIKQFSKKSKCIKLNVSGAFHSPLMKFAREALAININALSFNNPKIPVFQNINAKPTKDSKKIKENLILQLENPVQWCSTINNMIKYLKSNKFIECGPNTVLAGINRRISKDIETINTDTINKIDDIWIKN
tara:strand:+ start:342 stop:1268 length:927 start_codon:yes stop_codon:yes gene_type:complete